MAKRIVLAGVLGGIVMFFWGFVWHDLLPTGLAGLRSLPNEAAIVGPMKASIPEAGLYIFPGLGVPDDAPFSEKKAAMQKMMQNLPNGPEGFLIYQPVGAPLSAKLLVTEGSTNIIQALLMAFLVAQLGVRRFSSRVGFAFVVGLLASITTNISLWNFYRFPTPWVEAQIASLVIGYFLVGMVVAAIVKTGAGKSATASA